MTISSTPQKIKTNLTNYSNKVKADAIPADPDIVITAPTTFPVGVQADLILQAIGGTELLYYARHDTVNGQKVLYQPLKDVNELAISYSPQNIAGSAQTWRGYRNSFEIQIDDKRVSDGPTDSGSVYVDYNVGGTYSNVVVELDGLLDADVIEIAIASAPQTILFSPPEPTIHGGAAEQIIDGTVYGGNELGYNIDMTVNGGAV